MDAGWIVDKFKEGIWMSRSNASKKKVQPSGPHAFEVKGLVQELLSLGHPKLTEAVARKIATKVQVSLEDLSPEQINAATVSERVAVEFQELGLLPEGTKGFQAASRAKQASPAKSKAPKNKAIPQLPESLKKSSRVPGRLKAGEQAALSTLEKMLTRPSESREARAEKSQPMSPPQARFQAELSGLELWAQHQAIDFEPTRTLRDLTQGAQALAEQVAAGDHTLAVEYFNAMANQEFFPHVDVLLGKSSPWARGTGQVWMDLPGGLDSAESALWDATKLWQAGGMVSFALDLKPGQRQWNLAALERFLQDIESALMGLPEECSPPAWVGLAFPASHPHAAEFIDLCLSGRFYPRFALALQRGEQEIPAKWMEKISAQVPSLWFLPRTQGNGTLLPRWGGGPWLRTQELCHLGSLNLAIVASGNEVDWPKLRRMIQTAVNFLDGLLDCSTYATEILERRTLQSRKLGLGVMGFAELLAKLGFPYDGPQTLTLAEKLSRFMEQEARAASEALAQKRGSYPRHADEPGRAAPRNETLTGVCPVSALSRLAGVSAGLEPFENLMAPQAASESSPKPLALLETLAKRHGVWTPALANELIQRGSVRACTQAAAPLKKLFAHRQEIDPQWILKLQAAWEGVSDTVAGLSLKQVPGEISFNEFKLSVLSLQQNPLAAATSEPLSATSGQATHSPENGAADPAEEVTEIATVSSIKPRPRPKQLSATSEEWSSPHGPLWLSLSQDEQGPRELMLRWGKAGSDAALFAETLSRLVTLLLACGVDPSEIIAQLEGLRSAQPFEYDGREVLSLPDGVAQFLAQQIPQESFEEEAAEASEEITESNLVSLPSRENDEEVTEVIKAGTLH